jgi:hypothetical protein
MENAVDAIKMAFGVIVFAIAITLTFSVIGQAKAAADVVLAATDTKEFYDYVATDDYNTTEDRIVSFDTILPTIYRYAKEQYAVTIFDSYGNPIVRYDLYTEGFMSNWNEVIKNLSSTNTEIQKKAQNTYDEVENRLQQVQDVVNNHLGLENPKKIMEYIGNERTISSTNLLYSGNVTDTNSKITVVSPWVGESDTDTVERIRADMTGNNYVKNGITYYGKGLKAYKDKKFVEKFIEISTSGQTLTDGSDSIELIRGNKKLEIIYIVQD